MWLNFQNVAGPPIPIFIAISKDGVNSLKISHSTLSRYSAELILVTTFFFSPVVIILKAIALFNIAIIVLCNLSLFFLSYFHSLLYNGDLLFQILWTGNTSFTDIQLKLRIIKIETSDTLF